MLQRIGPDTFQARTGETIQVIAVAANNGGVEAARFRFGPAPLPATQIQGHPGCSFVVRTPTTMLGCVVVFAPGSANARYDLFEVDVNGTLIDLQEPTDPGTGPLVQFRIRGAAVPVHVGVAGAAPAPPARLGSPPPRPRRSTAAKKKKKTVTKKTPAAKKSGAKTPAAKKTAKKKPAAKKRSGAKKKTSATKKKTSGRPARTRTRGGR
jgi:hypothetical protein